ncbi:MAG TPA: AmmeMemoRadiSam system protein B [Candidatus Acidoferrales bacterium]|nr:AmmeMemoRadiSam system protein B [Candidatus Acidoferrales bacterium]
MIRPAAVSGRFYPADAAMLLRQIDGCVSVASQKIRARGCIVPHAGYMYSGHVAGTVYGALDLPSRFILLGPRHYPHGERLAILSQGAWTTPLGDAKIDVALADAMKKSFPLLREDAVAHSLEHSLEVQLPFLQTLAEDFTFVPIVLGTDRFDALEMLGHAVAQVVRGQKETVLIIASSDMNHRESDTITRVKDRKAINAILALDAHELYDTVRRENITMCGYGPAVVMLTAARELGSTSAELLQYATSGDVNGDHENVVGYAGIIVR